MPLPLALVLAAVSAAGPTTAADPIKLAAPTLQSVGLDPARASFLSDYFAQQLSGQGLRVTTSNEIATLIGLERQKELLACDDQATGCMAELAGALGVDGVITGSLAKTENGSFAVAVKIISARDGAPLALATGRLKNEDAVLDYFADQAPRMAAEVKRALRPQAVVEVPATVAPVLEEQASAPASSKAWVPLAVGGALVVAGGTLYGLARGSEADLRAGAGAAPGDEGLQAASRAGQAKETLGFSLLGAGVGAAAAGGALMAFGDQAKAKAWIPMAAGAGVAVVGGVFYALARGSEARLRSGEGLAGAAGLSNALNAGRAQETLGFTLAAAGLAALATGGVTMVLSASKPVSISLSAGGQGAGLVLSGAFK